MELSQEQTSQAVGLGQQTLAAWIAGDYDYTRPRRREIREATVVAVDDSQVIVDLGVKRDGIVPKSDLESLNEEYRAGLHVGDVIPVSVLDTSDRHDGILVSIRKGLADQDWLRARDLLGSGETLEAEVTAVNRGGVVVPFGQLRGFVPNSHLSSVRRGLHGEKREQAKTALIGRTLSLAVIEVDQKRRRLVLSERIARQLQRQRILEELVPGEVRTGTVRNIVEYGAFVDLGGIDGLLHISEMDWKRVQHPSDVLSEGDVLQVYVVEVDRERERIRLSRKRLLPDPWSLVAERLVEGEVIDGTVTNVVSFGAFVDIGDGLEGLVHTSQMPDGDNTRAVLQIGSSVRVQVLKLEPWRRRISLSMHHIPQQYTSAKSVDQ